MHKKTSLRCEERLFSFQRLRRRRRRLHPLVDGSELLRALHLALHGRLGDFHHAAGLQLHLLLEGPRGDAVELLALGRVADVHTHDVLADVEVSRGVSTLLLVLQRGEERSQTVQLDGDALTHELRHAGGELAQDALHDVHGPDAAVLGDVLRQAASVQR